LTPKLLDSESVYGKTQCSPVLRSKVWPKHSIPKGKPSLPHLPLSHQTMRQLAQRRSRKVLVTTAAFPTVPPQQDTTRKINPEATLVIELPPSFYIFSQPSTRRVHPAALVTSLMTMNRPLRTVIQRSTTNAEQSSRRIETLSNRLQSPFISSARLSTGTVRRKASRRSGGTSERAGQVTAHLSRPIDC
jgi:hypothetical protein